MAPGGDGTYPRDSISPDEQGSHRQRATRGRAEYGRSCAQQPKQVRRNRGSSATSSSMKPAKPMTPQQQAPGLMIPGEGTGRRGWPQTAHSRRPLPPVPLDHPGPACPHPYPWEGRSHLELHLELELTEPLEGGGVRWGQRPGSNPSQGSTDQWGSLPAPRS